MPNIVVVYHSGYGHTERVAQTIAQAAHAQLVKIDQEGNIADQDWEALNQADTIVFGSPTYMGNVSWQFKNSPMRPPKHGSPAHGATSCLRALPTAPA